MKVIFMIDSGTIVLILYILALLIIIGFNGFWLFKEWIYDKFFRKKDEENEQNSNT